MVEKSLIGAAKIEFSTSMLFFNTSLHERECCFVSLKAMNPLNMSGCLAQIKIFLFVCKRNPKGSQIIF